MYRWHIKDKWNFSSFRNVYFDYKWIYWK